MSVAPGRWAALALAAVVLLAGCSSGHGKRRNENASAGSSVAALRASARLASCPAPGRRATGARILPALTVECLGGGPPVELDRLTGRPAVVNLWASWCGPCRDETPGLQAFAALAGGRVRVLGVASEDASRQAALSFLVAAGARYPVAYDESGKLRRELGVSGLPGTVLLRSDGSIATIVRAPVTTASLAAAVRRYLGVTV